MGASGRNILKFISGSAIGAGIGAAIARGAETAGRQGPPVRGKAEQESAADRIDAVAEDAESKVKEARASIRDRWEHAQAAGEAAREEREAELRAYFREKVDDPTAFPPGAPTRTDV